MQNTYLVYAKRTPMGKIGGALAPVRTDDLMAHVLKDFKQWAPFDLTEIDDVMVGCSNQAGEDNRNVARMALLLAGLPFAVPGVTINRLCGSSLDATIGAASRISAGLADCIVVGGVESMSRGPYIISKTAAPYGRDQKMYDSSFGWRFTNPKMEELFPLYGMGETAEEIYNEIKISREEQDQFALASHQKAAQADSNGEFEQELVPVEVQLRKKSYTVEKDECVQADTNLEKLSKLPAVFRKNGTVTAGNSSPMNDGASAVCVVSEEFLKRHKLTPFARITGGAVRGRHPNTMGLGPVDAIKRLEQKFSLPAKNFDVYELNEAFAIQALACMKQLEIDPSKVNLRGGAIALGHPLGCSGTRILTTLLHNMKDRPNVTTGLASMCIGVGQGIALSVEKC